MGTVATLGVLLVLVFLGVTWFYARTLVRENEALVLILRCGLLVLTFVVLWSIVPIEYGDHSEGRVPSENDVAGTNERE